MCRAFPDNFRCVWAHYSTHWNDWNVREMPGFGPAAEILFFREKDPKPLTLRPASLHGMDARLRRADQLATLKQGPPDYTSVHPWDRAAGVEHLEEGIAVLSKYHTLWN